MKNTLVRKDTAFYVATNSITANSNFTINSSAYVNFQVGNSSGNVILKDGFLTRQGSEFHAFIGGQVPKRSNVEESTIAIETNGIPITYSLLDNYPNPFNPETKISYEMAQDGFATVRVYDFLGREIMTLVDRYQTAGKYVVTFNAAELPSGMYVYQLTVNDFISTKKMLLLK
ncbi:MAG: T9SS type A sorting domain-containing protein [bacterium]